MDSLAFFYEVKEGKNWEDILCELVSKKLALPLDVTIQGLFGADELSALSDNSMLEPKILDRDIYLVFRNDDANYKLAMNEWDFKLNAKQKELFWILYTHLTKAKPISRTVYWSLFYLSIIVFGFAIIINIIRTICIYAGSV